MPASKESPPRIPAQETFPHSKSPENIKIVKDSENEFCVVAVSKFSIGDIIRTLATPASDNGWQAIKGQIISSPTKTSIQLDQDGLIHIEDPYGQYINHSCDPTTKIEHGKIIAIKEIYPDDEISFNYNETESELSHPFIDKDTGKHIRGKNKKLLFNKKG